METLLVSSDGRSLMVVTNGQRAMVWLQAEPGDEGEHAIDPASPEGRSDGYLLSNGQSETYADYDTIPLDAAVACIAQLIDLGTRSAAVSWQDDRIEPPRPW